MPSWLTPRRLGAVTALYAVFLAGWWLGRPVWPDGCAEGRFAAGADRAPTPVEPADPGRYFDHLGLDLGFLGSGGAGDAPCDEKRARLLSWVNGDWG
ncbi:hypothetical protein [Streptomyces violaceorubidus]|uniref:hypothetical protein n=1 Tax=Streptomyces violaceorubidus TaxID=284042 RepID=UPI0004C1D8BA|nr:hypothetical protein [Streptomyces violaceorubidus]